MGKQRIPSYRHHRPSGLAVVTIRGHDHYLGPHGSEESKKKYNLLVARYLAGDEGEAPAGITLGEVISRYWRHVEAMNYDFRQADRIKRALGVARDLYGDEPADTFRGRALKAVQQKMVSLGWCRRTINQRVGCIKAAARWALSEELISADAAGSLRAVSPLLQGRTEAPESPKVVPAPPEHVEASLGHLGPFLADAVRLQVLTAARPGEVLALNACELDVSRPVWVFNLGRHKTRWRGHKRAVLVGPRGQEIARRYLRYLCPSCGKTSRFGRPCCPGLDARPPFLLEDYYLFSPALAREERFADMRARRRTKVQPSQLSRAGEKPKKRPGQKYRVDSYGKAVQKACERAGVPAWRPHMLRHSAATEIRKEWGIEVAQIVLGHASLQATEIYAESDLAKAMEAVLKRG